MKKVFFATTNTHKVMEISKILSNFGIQVISKPLKIVEPDFDSLEEVAVSKAQQAFEQLKKPVIVEDTGVFFEGYNSFPGALAKRVYFGIGFDGLLALIKNSKNKNAFFKTIVCFAKSKNEIKSFSGTLKGTLLENVVLPDENRLPYEKIFVPNGFEKPLVELSLEEKNKISHRAIATRKLGGWLEKNY
jgi:XTP/dITP diphosphohydrolase